MATISTEFDESDEIEMDKKYSKADDEKFVTVRLCLEGLDELSVIFLQDQFETVLQDIEEGTGGEDLVWAYRLILEYNMSSKDYQRYMKDHP